jgi:hypothetical protein
VACDLCYRRCDLAPGEHGWCNYRRNDNGTLRLTDHAILSRCQPLILGYMGGIHTFLPGAPALGIGATRCTARCAFCTSNDIIFAPEKIPWRGGVEGAVGGDASWYYRMRAILHPEGVVGHALDLGKKAIVFADFWLPYAPGFAGGLCIESKWQQSSGSVDEKLPYLWHNIEERYPCPVVVVLHGGGYRPGAEAWLRGKVGGNLLAVYGLEEFLKWINTHW